MRTLAKLAARSIRSTSGESDRPTYKYRPFEDRAMHLLAGSPEIGLGSEIRPVVGSMNTMDRPRGESTVKGMLAHNRLRVGSWIRLLAANWSWLTVFIPD